MPCWSSAGCERLSIYCRIWGSSNRASSHQYRMNRAGRSIVGAIGYSTDRTTLRSFFLFFCREKSDWSSLTPWTSKATAASTVAAVTATANATMSPCAVTGRGRTTTRAGASSAKSLCHATGGSHGCSAESRASRHVSMSAWLADWHSWLKD